MTEEVRRKDITIRGLRADLYRKAAELAKRSGRTIGEIFNESLSLFLELTGVLMMGLEPLAQGTKFAAEKVGESISMAIPSMVSDIQELSVSRSDLERYGKRVIFSNIGKLSLEEDVDEETFKKYVALIRNCQELRVPKGLSKLLVLSRCRGVQHLIEE